MSNFVRVSLETHLFFCRIMKEHSLFLMAGFPTKNSEHVEKADWYREQFEDLLREVVELSNGVVGRSILESGEVVTDYTKNAEKSTSCLTGIPIDSSITERSERLSFVNNCQQSRSDYSEQRNRQNSYGNRQNPYGNRQSQYGNRQNPYGNRQSQYGNRQRQYGNRYSQYDNRQRNQYHLSVTADTSGDHMHQKVRTINDKALELVKGLICFKEDILRDVGNGDLYTSNYPLLIEHIMREAKLYRDTIVELNEKGDIHAQDHRRMEQFWNQIMMEHALFIRGLLDPSEEELVRTAHEFSEDYRELLAEARERDCLANDDHLRRTIRKTKEYRDFKAAGTKGITECEINSVILPLLADHVLREANHYLRILQM